MARSTLRQTLNSRARWGWVLYDWANSAYVLSVVTVIGSAYFVHTFESAAQESGRAVQLGPALAMALGPLRLTAEAAWSLIVGAGAFAVAVSSPFLGALADRLGRKKRFLEVYCLAGVLVCLALWFDLPWWLVGLLILLGNIGFDGGNVFYNSFLPELADGHEQDVLSSAGYAFGYLGGVVVLVAALFLYTDIALAEPVGSIRNTFLLVGLWWGGFALLTFAWVPETAPVRRGTGPNPSIPRMLAEAWRELRGTLRDIARYRQAALFLAAFLLYNDGIATLISNATPYALQNIYLDEALTQRITLTQLIPAIIMIQFIAFPGSLLCGWLATRIGDKPTLYLTLAVFTVVVTYGQVAHHVNEFYVMAALIGLVLGGAQALSRSLFASFVPPGKNAEFFAFFALSSKFSAVIGPLVYGGLLLWTGDTRLAILSLTVFFVAGGTLLFFVNIAAGRQQAGRPPVAE